MKQGMTINDLAVEITRQMETKQDFVVQTRGLKAQSNGDVKLSFDDDAFGITKWGHTQISQVARIPKDYYDRLKESSPELLVENINHWFQRDDKKRLVRLLDGNVRALLSDRYRPLDYYDLVEHSLPKIQSLGCRVESCALTETKLYLKALFPKFEGEIGVGDVVQMGLVISNSEVGASSVRIEPLIYRLKCLNGLIMSDNAIRKFHVSKQRHDLGEFLRDETRRQIDKAFWMQVNDLIDMSLTEEFFQNSINKMRSTTENRIVGDPVKAIEVTAKRFNMQEGDKGGILSHLISGGDLSQWGLINAVTRYSQDVEDYDRATSLERSGGEILELGKDAWAEIAQAS